MSENRIASMLQHDIYIQYVRAMDAALDFKFHERSIKRLKNTQMQLALLSGMATIPMKIRAPTYDAKYKGEVESLVVRIKEFIEFKPVYEDDITKMSDELTKEAIDILEEFSRLLVDLNMLGDIAKGMDV